MVLTTIIWFIVIGAVVGALGRLVVPGRNPIGIGFTLLIGIAGAIVGGVIASAIGAGSLIAFILAVVVAAVVVAMVSGYRVGGPRYRRSRRRSR